MNGHFPSICAHILRKTPMAGLEERLNQFEEQLRRMTGAVEGLTRRLAEVPAVAAPVIPPPRQSTYRELLMRQRQQREQREQRAQQQREQRAQQQRAQQQVEWAERANNRMNAWVNKTEKKECVVKAADLDRPCEEDCMVCLEKHAKNTMVVLGCKHELGRECFLQMVHQHFRQFALREGVKCPLCRTPVKAFRGFRRRAAPQPRHPVAAAEN